MPIDASIPLASQAGQFANPFDLAMRASQMRAQQESTAALIEERQARTTQRNAQTAAAQQEAAQATALQGLKEWTPETLFPIVGPEKGATILKGLNDLRTTEIKNENDVRGLVGSVLGGIQALPEPARAGAYATAVQHLGERGIIDPSKVEAYSPEVLARYQQQALTPEQQVTTAATAAHNAAAEAATTAGQAETARHNAAIESKPAELGSLPDYIDTAARALGLRDGRSMNPRQKAAAIRDYEASKRAPQTADNEPLTAIMGPDGQSVLVPRSQAVGKRPASNKEQGRPVTSGDAGTLADFDSALDTLGSVRGTLKETEGSTGVMAKIGASLPNAVTESLGWGTDSKKRQAVIDAAKQMIGKTLEGGVLKREDEIKYEKILPNLGDPQAVAASKLDALEKTLRQKKQRQIDALTDAGYDTGKFSEHNGNGPRVGDHPMTVVDSKTPPPNKIGRFTVKVN